MAKPLPPGPPSTTDITIDASSGFFPTTQSFHSLRPLVALPPPTTSFISLLPSSPDLPSNPAFIVTNAATSSSLSYSSLLSHVHSLTSSLHSLYPAVTVASIISPPHLHIPTLLLSLLSLNITLSPINPSSTPTEIARLFSLTNPSIVFATSATLTKLPTTTTTTTPIILLDSPFFSSLLKHQSKCSLLNSADDQTLTTKPAAIMFSSGTTGHVKAAALSHARLVAMVLGFHAMRRDRGDRPEVTVLISPVFHAMGFVSLLKGLCLGETTVVMERFGFGDMMAAVERFGVTQLITAPPVVAAMGREEEVVVERFDLGSLCTVACGGAPLSVKAAVRFRRRFPWVQLRQVS